MDAFYLIADILSLHEGTPVRILARLAQLNSAYYDLVQARLKRYKAIYLRWAPRLAKRLWYNGVNHPVKYTGRAHTITKYMECLTDERNGIILFDIETIPFRAEFMRTTRIALSNITLWLSRPEEIYMTIILGNYAVCWRGFSPADCMRVPGTDLYYVTANLPGEHNPFLLGAPTLPHGAIMLAISRVAPIQKYPGAFITPGHDFEFAAQVVKKVIVNYLTAAETSHNWIKFGYLLDLSKRQWLTRSFVSIIE